MNVSEMTLTKVFPVQKQHTYDGIETRFSAVGHGKTVCISQIEDQPLYVDLYDFEAGSVEDLQDRKADKSFELNQVMPSGDHLHQLAAHYLAE